MSDTTADVETSIKTALATITNLWDMLIVSAHPSGIALGHRTGGKPSRGIPKHDPLTDPLGVKVEDDHLDTDEDIDRLTRVVSLRRFATDVLNGWSRVVQEDRPVTTALPDGSHVPGMAKFLTIHAQWLSGHDSAEDVVEELQKVANKVTAITNPTRKEWISLGSCPIECEFDPAAGLEVCGGQVRAWPRAEDREGECMARCQRCGTEAVASWWERQMFTDPELRQWLTDAELVPFLHSTFGVVVKEATIRQWVRREVLKPSGTDDRGRRLFNREAVVYAMDRKIKREAVG